MFVKGTVVATIMAAALAFMPQTASAKTNINIGIGIGAGYGWCYNHPYALGCGFGYRHRHFYPRFYPWFYPQYYPPVYQLRISCGEARQIVANHGFRKVRARSCGGKVDSFYGWRGGHPWLVKVNTRNGGILGAWRM